MTGDADLADDRGSGAPGQVRRKPGGGYVAVRIENPAAWVVVSAASGRTWTVRIAEWRAGDIYEWPVLFEAPGVEV